MASGSRLRIRLGALRRTLGDRWLGLVAPARLFYVISHERSGTHFVMNTIMKNTYVRQGFHDLGGWPGPYDAPARRFAHIDAFNRTWDTAPRTAAMIKSHCDRALFDARYRQAKVVYVLRDPRDVLTSFFHYLNRPEFARYNPGAGDHRSPEFPVFLHRPISPFLRNTYSLAGNFANVAERWAAHVAGWLNTPATLTVRYEDLHQNHAAVLARLVAFLDLRPRRRTRPVALHDAPSILPRKGVIGDWRSAFAEGDEAFLRAAVERAGVDWTRVTVRT